MLQPAHGVVVVRQTDLPGSSRRFRKLRLIKEASMLRSKIVLRTLLCLVLITGVVAVLPAAAQEADWLVSNERGTVGISSPAVDDTISGVVVPWS